MKFGYGLITPVSAIPAIHAPMRTCTKRADACTRDGRTGLRFALGGRTSFLGRQLDAGPFAGSRCDGCKDEKDPARHRDHASSVAFTGSPRRGSCDRRPHLPRASTPRSWNRVAPRSRPAQEDLRFGWAGSSRPPRVVQGESLMDGLLTARRSTTLRKRSAGSETSSSTTGRLSTPCRRSLVQIRPSPLLRTSGAPISGSFLEFLPTGRAVDVPFVNLLRFEDGMMVEYWGVFPSSEVVRQLVDGEGVGKSDATR